MFSTIGYEQAELEDFIATLVQADIDVLVDVRDIPVSRRKGFSKNALREALKEAGIDYVHLRGLGDPKPGREAARSGQYALFQKIYITHLESEKAKADFERAVSIVSNSSACLMCYERDHHRCHRTLVGEKISAITGYTIRNLGVREGLAGGGRKGRSRKSLSSREGATTRR